MKRFIWVIFLVLSLQNIVNAQHNWRNNKIKKDNGVISNKSILPNAVLSINRDTIPLGRYKYFEIDEVRYKKYLFTNVTNDSVKLLIANAEDWSEFSKAHDSLNDILRENKYNNVNNYIDTSSDFKEFKLLNKTLLPNTAKVCIRQLTFNIKLLNQLLGKRLTDKTDLGLLNSVIKNIDVLVNNYIAPIGNINVMKRLVLSDVSIHVFDKFKRELNNVQCYFISRKSCRDIACITCLPALDPCDRNNVNAIINNPDISYDCANPVNIKINFGHYHLFIISNNKIRYYEMKHFDENSFSATGSNEIKIFL